MFETMLKKLVSVSTIVISCVLLCTTVAKADSFGADYAQPTDPTSIQPAIINAQPMAFVCRYLSGGRAKDITAAEYASLQSSHIAVVLVWETTATRASQGLAAGVQDAQAAIAEASTFGWPADRPIYFAVDYDASWDGIKDYFQGTAQVLGMHRVGIYGGIKVTEPARTIGAVGYAWQTYAWSGGGLGPSTQLYQFSNDHNQGVNLDWDHALAADYGQYPYTPSMPVVPHKEGIGGLLLGRQITTHIMIASIINVMRLFSSPQHS